MRGAPETQLAVVILTFNEELNLPACLAGLAGLPCAVYVVDSGSTDGTLEIALSNGAQVLNHPFVSHARQWQWALANLPSRPSWILGLDADQRLTPELRAELIALFGPGASAPPDVAGFYLRRRQVFRGRWIRHGGYYPKYLLKLFRSDAVFLDERDLMDHHFYVHGRVCKLEGDLIEANVKEDEISFWIDKHNRYAALHAREELLKRSSIEPGPLRPAVLGTPDQRTLVLKHLWYRLPLYVRPFLYFVYRYFCRAGFLDGKEGLIFHVLQGFWYRLLVDINIDQLQGVNGAAAHGA
jgi:glycosyltransferase involved in cell wall biosynthesis